MNILDLKHEPDKLGILAEWHQQEWSYLNLDNNLQNRLEKMQTHLNKALVPSTFIAKENNNLLGSAAIIEHDMDTHMDLSPWLASVFVAAEYRRNGVGSALVLHVIEQAKQEGVDILYLFTPNQESFYQRFGWLPMSCELYRGQEVTVMQIILNS